MEKPRIFGSGLRAAVAVAMVSGAISVATPAIADPVKSWQKKVVTLVGKKQVYPRSAIMKEIEGQAKVKVSIDRSGSLQGFEMVEATGHDVLDKEVDKLMKRINPLPAPPEELPDNKLTFVLPLSWVLQ